MPVCRDRFTMEVRTGSRDNRRDLNTETGTGSSAQALIGDLLTSSRTSICERVWKEEKEDEAQGLVKEL